MSGSRARRAGDDDRPWVVWVVVGAVTAVACVVAVVVLGSGGSDETPNSRAGPVDGESLYAQHCANCHAIDGRGAIGPQLSDGAVVDAYPDIEDQIAVIVEGRGAMPPFGERLSDEEIRAIAEHERALSTS